MVLSMTWSNPLKVCEVFCQLFDAVNLFIKEVALQEVTHLRQMVYIMLQKGLNKIP